MSVRSKIRRLFAGRPALSANTVEHSKVESAVLGDWRKRATPLQEAFAERPVVSLEVEREDGLLDAEVWRRLGEDVFFSYYGRQEPHVLDEAAIDPRYRVNRLVIDKHSRADEFVSRRPSTRGQGFEACLGTMAALDSLRRSYQDELQEHGKRANEVGEAEDDIRDLDEAMGRLREDRAAEGAEVIDAAIRAMAAEKRAATATLAAALAEQDAHAVALQADTRAAAQKAAQAGDKAVKQAANMVGKGAGTERRVSPEQMFALAERYAQSRILQKVAEMVGRLEVGMGSKRRTLRKGGNEEMVDIELGGDLANVLPQEKLRMRHPQGRVAFFIGLQERALSQYEMWSEEELKRGPVVILVDSSDSMRGPRNVWARATALATAGIANREGREACIVEFGSSTQQVVYRFRKGQPLDPIIAADCAEHFFAGGTAIGEAIQTAADIIDDEAPFHAADIVLITDGADHWTSDDEARREALVTAGVHVHGVMVGSASLSFLDQACETVTHVADIDLAGMNAANNSIAINLS